MAQPDALPQRGICETPASGAAALVQHANQERLCLRNPPYGFLPLCTGADGTAALTMLRGLRDPARCYYRSCAVVGASGNLLGARLGAQIDAHDAVIRVNHAPDGLTTSRMRNAPHSHRPTWVADIGKRTTWRFLTMEGYAYLMQYSRLWLAPPLGHGTHANMSGVPQEPLLAIVCHTPGKTMGRCRAERLTHNFAHPESVSYLVNPELLAELDQEHFRNVKGQRTPSTGMSAIAFARKMCGQVHLYGFGNGTCGRQCYHFYECVPAAATADGHGAAGAAFADQQKFLDDAGATGGFHNFSAQALALLRMVSRNQVVAHWGTCAPNDGGAPEAFRNLGPSKRGRAGGGRGRRRARSQGSAGLRQRGAAETRH
jgi:hypothetical protein